MVMLSQNNGQSHLDSGYFFRSMASTARAMRVSDRDMLSSSPWKKWVPSG